MCTGYAAGNSIVLLFTVETGWSLWEKHNKQAKTELRERRYFRSIRTFTDLDQVILNDHDGVVTLSRTRIQDYVIDGFNVYWITSLYRNPNTAGVYLARVWDKTKTVHAIIIDARTGKPLIYDFAELHRMKLSVSSLCICFGYGYSESFYRFDEVRRVLYTVKRPEQLKEKSNNKIRRFQEKKAQKKAEKDLNLL